MGSGLGPSARPGMTQELLIDSPAGARFMRAMTFACLLARNYYAPSS